MVNEHIKKISARKEDSHKGDYGKVLVIAGSAGMTGAAYLASEGALLAGSGLVTLVIPASLNAIMETKLTEVMTLPVAEIAGAAPGMKARDAILDHAEKCDIIAIGPGLGLAHETGILVKTLLGDIKKPVVLDADGLNLLEGDYHLLSERDDATVITPHPGEMARLKGETVENIQADRTKAAKELSEKTGAVVCLKGHGTVVADPSGNVYVNSSGNSGMATGGTGDVLTGMITSFIGQGIDAYSAAVSAVYLHGLAGDIAAEHTGPFSLVATDLLKYLSEAFKKAGIV